mgnify:CR=1 FL=1
MSTNAHQAGSPELLARVLDQIELVHRERRTPGAEYTSDRRMLEFVEYHLPAICAAARKGLEAERLVDPLTADSQDRIHQMLVQAANDGQRPGFVCGMIGMSITAALIYLRGISDGDVEIPPDVQEKLVDEACLIKAKAFAYAKLAAEKLLPDGSEDTRGALADAIAVQTCSIIDIYLTALACGAKPAPTFGMASMFGQAIIRDLGFGKGDVAEGGAA